MIVENESITETPPFSSGRPLAFVAGYAALLFGSALAFYLVHDFGRDLQAPPANILLPVANGAAVRVDVTLHLTATLAAVIGAGFLLGRVSQWLGQPAVIGEIVAGLLLGPSFLGLVAPQMMHLLIPPIAADPHQQVSAAIGAVAQLGVILYMFLVGLELNGARLAKQAQATVAIAHASIFVPFVAGLLLALALYPVFSNAAVSFTSFALFMGAAISVTAFPVLARILADRGLDKTPLGVLALGCAAAIDVTAWCLLAVVVAVAEARLASAATVLTGAVIFIVLMLILIGPLFRNTLRRWDNRPGPLPQIALPVTFLAVLLAACATEAIGIHAVFGAFLFGVIIPHDSRLSHAFTAKLKDPVTMLLLPAFFAYTGMRTQIGLLSKGNDWLWCGFIILVAGASKMGGTYLAARLVGLPKREAGALGVLMNSRGLMELVVLNIGLDLGVISPTLFTMLVVMALVATALTAPLLGWLLGKAALGPQPESSEYPPLIPRP